jgi:hypothetical protein
MCRRFRFRVRADGAWSISAATRKWQTCWTRNCPSKNSGEPSRRECGAGRLPAGCALPFRLPDVARTDDCRRGSICRHRHCPFCGRAPFNEPKSFHPPSSQEEALYFCDNLLTRPNHFRAEPGPRHWMIFSRLCIDAKANGNPVTDAWIAAIAIEWGCEVITFDRDFSMFKGLCHSKPA